MLTINSLENPTVKRLVRLKKSGERKEAGVFLVDGRREIEIAVKAGWQIESLVLCPELIKSGPESGPLGNGIAVSPTVFKKICYKENPDGYLALLKIRDLSLGDLKPGDKELIVVLENVEKPGNLGAIMRTAYAAGVTAVVINDNQTDIYNPNVIRASEGQLFNLKVVKASVDETVAWLAAKKIASVAAATGGATRYTDLNFTGSCAMVFGSEADGLSRRWLDSATHKAKIPMKKGIDSLNVSVAAAIMLFEAARQRAV